LNVGLSVSRVGSAAQTRAMKQVAGKLRLELAQFRELAAFAQFGTAELDKATRDQLERGRRITEILKQPQYVPVPMEKQVMILYAVINGYLDELPVDNITAFEDDFHRFMEANHPEIGKAIAKDKELTADTEEALKKAIAEFKQGYSAG
jgi:F-type H+-transporting ATPase subunit alpha